MDRVMDHNHQLHPLEVNPKTGEPFLRLKDHPNIILTPPRDDDAPAIVPPLNDARVYHWLGALPYPYTPDHAKAFVDTISSGAQQVLRQLDDAKAEDKAITVGGCPVRSLREVKADGTDVYIGDLGVTRCRHGELMGTDSVDWDNKAQREQENNSLAVGDPNIVWSMGNWVVPHYHGRGIMTDAVNTVLHQWCIPRMNVQHMWVSTFMGNAGSVRVFEKNGFMLIKSREEHAAINGTLRGLNLLEWRVQS